MKLLLAVSLFAVAIYVPDLPTSSAIFISVSALLVAWHCDGKRFGRK